MYSPMNSLNTYQDSIIESPNPNNTLRIKYEKKDATKPTTQVSKKFFSDVLLELIKSSKKRLNPRMNPLAKEFRKNALAMSVETNRFMRGIFISFDKKEKIIQ